MQFKRKWLQTLLITVVLRCYITLHILVNEDNESYSRFLPEEVLIEEYHPTEHENDIENVKTHTSEKEDLKKLLQKDINKPINNYNSNDNQLNSDRYHKTTKHKKKFHETNSIKEKEKRINYKSKLKNNNEKLYHQKNERSDVDTMQRLDEQEKIELNEWISLNEAADKILKEQHKNIENNIMTEHYISKHNKPRKIWPEKEATTSATMTDFLGEEKDTFKDMLSTNKKPKEARVIENSDEDGKNTDKKPICDFCHNDGLCVFRRAPQNFKCYCRFGYSGRFCELRSVENHKCLPSTCFNGGTCIEKPKKLGGYKCKCKRGYHGQQCAESDVLHWRW